MKVKRPLKLVRKYIDYFLPREIMGPVIIVFSMENVVDILFMRYLGDFNPLFSWTVVLIISIIVIGYWGEADEDMEEFEQELEDDGIVEMDSDD